jgi:hypothetical protein
MKPRILIAVLLAIAFAKVCPAEDWDWRTPLQVKQIALATQLATFPLPQGELRSVIGVTKLPHLGGSTDAQGRVYGIVALTDPDAQTGYYAVRLVYDLEKEAKPEEIPILSAVVLFVSPARGSFVSELGDTMTRLLPELRKQMAERKLTPIGFAESFHDGALEAIRANQRPEANAGEASRSTSTLVPGVAHP